MSRPLNWRVGSWELSSYLIESCFLRFRFVLNTTDLALLYRVISGVERDHSCAGPSSLEINGLSGCVPLLLVVRTRRIILWVLRIIESFESFGWEWVAWCHSGKSFIKFSCLCFLSASNFRGSVRPIFCLRTGYELHRVVQFLCVSQSEFV